MNDYVVSIINMEGDYCIIHASVIFVHAHSFLVIYLSLSLFLSICVFDAKRKH